MNDQARRNWSFTALLLLTAIVVLPAMLPVRVDPVLQLQLSRNAKPISLLDQPRQITEQRSHWIDKLDLARHGRLAHPRLGALGWGEHYFLDLHTRIELDQTTSVRFEVRSDDGFALQIDERRICAFTGDRPLSRQICTVLLLAGSHDLRLSYFQGGGDEGLAIRYASGEDTNWYWLGEDSASMRFVRP